VQIRARLAASFAAGTAVLIAVGGIVFVHALSDGLRNGVLTGLEARTATISQNLRSGGSNAGLGIAAPDQPAGAISDQDEVAQILSPTGRILAATRPSTATALLTAGELSAAQRGDLVLRRNVAGFDTPMQLFAGPAHDANNLVVVTGQTLETVNSATDRVKTALLIGGPIAVVLAAGAAWLIAGAALRPVERMRRQAADISAHDSDATLDAPHTRDEIAALGQTLNALLERLQGALSRQRGFAAAAGHELRTPLANLKLELELASRPARSQEELAAAVAAAASEVDRLSRLAEDLLVLARSDEAAVLALPAEGDVVSVIAEAVDSFATEAARRSIELRLTGPPRLYALIDDARLRQILDNLLDNALRFAPSGSKVEISVHQEAADVEIAVLDSGPGFPTGFLPRAFERFSRADEGRERSHGGAGLGLAIVKALTEAHGGRVDASNRPTGGAIVRVSIPLSPRASDVDRLTV
jgi:two-component system OmpR family sensor kinase